MMMRLRTWFLVLLVVPAALAVLLSVHASGASFTRASDSTISVTTATTNGWLHLYSESTDPDGLTNYYHRNGSSPATPAATGVDTTLAVNLGGQGSSGTATINRMLTIKTPSAFPVGTVTQVTVTATRQADPATGFQPITQAGFDTVGGTARTSPVTLGVTTKRQMNVRLSMDGSHWGTQYVPSVLITVTYSGFTTTYYQYSVPVKIYAGNGAGPD
jgi:hypothetical protein